MAGTAVTVGMYAVALSQEQLVRITEAFTRVTTGLAMDGITVNVRHETHDVDDNGNVIFK